MYYCYYYRQVRKEASEHIEERNISQSVSQSFLVTHLSYGSEQQETPEQL